MRKKIGKRIGPVPITLVAVFTLAAFISVGLLITLNGGVIQAQGLAVNPETAPTKCEVIVHDAIFSETDNDKFLTGGGCFVSDDTVDVIFKNTDDSGGSAIDKSIAVYVTGGDDFPGLQATEEMDNQLKSLGAEGIDEYLLTVDAQEEGFGSLDQDVPGTETITVSRDMAKNGEIYIFVYLAGGATKVFPHTGVPISVLTKEIKADDGPNGVQMDAISLANQAKLISLVTQAVTAARQPVMTATTPLGDLVALFSANADEDNYLAALAGVVADSALVTAEEAQTNVSKAMEKIAEIKAARDYNNEGRNQLQDDVAEVELAIMLAQSAIDAIEGADPSYFLNDDADSAADIVVRVNFRETAVEAKKSDGMYVDFDNEERGSEIYLGRKSINAVNEDSEIRTGAEEATVTVTIRDRYGVALAGFVDFSIDTSAVGAADVVFTNSNRSTHYVELEKSGLGRGSATVPIEGLPKIDPLKIPVTASFNNGELELTGNIIRKGDAMMVEATAYVCEADD